jgi:hypothetical protein
MKMAIDKACTGRLQIFGPSLAITSEMVIDTKRPNFSKILNDERRMLKYGPFSIWVQDL